MEEDKAAAYYEELTRKGEGAARFKQGLGFSSSSDDAVPVKGSAFTSSSSSFLSQFVRASSPTSTAKLEKESQLRSIQDKLKKKSEDRRSHRTSEKSLKESSQRHRSPSRERDGTEDRRRRRGRSRTRSRSSERYGDGEREKDRYRDRGRSRRSRSRERYRDRDRDRDSRRDTDKDRARKRRSRSRSRSLSPRSGRLKSEDEKRERSSKGRKGERHGKVDYSRLIDGYDKMSAAERVKTKMKLQLAETAEKDKTKGAGWERFEFDKDAPLDDDEEVEAADDDAALVKQIGQSFRYSAIEARREEQLKAAHDEAMFGAPPIPISADSEEVEVKKTEKDDGHESNTATSLLSEKVLAKQQGSWRDRARKA